MPKVRITGSISSHEHFGEHGGQPPIGTVVDLPTHIAEQLVESGYAVPAEKTPKRVAKPPGPSERRY